MHHPSICLIILARFPKLGQVKTRLAAAVGSPHALGLYTSFLRDILTSYAATKIPLLPEPGNGLAQFAQPRAPGLMSQKIALQILGPIHIAKLQNSPPLALHLPLT